MALSDISVSKKKQNLASFPSNNEKRIDYVLNYSYKVKDVNKEDFKLKESMRKSFLNKLKEESVEIYTIQFREDDEYNVFILLHCPIERLLREAEYIKLEMKTTEVRFFKN